MLTGAEREAVLWNGPVLELDKARTAAWGRTSSPSRRTRAMLARLRGDQQRRELGDALLDQRLVAGIGNVWKAESLWHAHGSRPGCGSTRVSDEELGRVLGEAARLMRAATRRKLRRAPSYRRAGRRCPRCGTPIRSRGQGDDNRTAYWCPGCQRGEERPGA